MRYPALAVAALVAAASSARAQARFAPQPGPEFRPLVGAFVPTGKQADNFKSNVLVGGQLAFELSDYFHVVGEFSWTPSREKFNVQQVHRADIYQYDAGVEFNLLRRLNDEWYFRPFAGIGGGGRTYGYNWNLPNRTNGVGYGTLGLEFQRGVYALRFEARDNVSRFEIPSTGATPGARMTVNDLHFAVGLAYHVAMR
ncbi:MAG: outer membrane beta-barrel protein [Gemmatimonadota bacterium]|nr:outer membrane beta-barrel protein [Gemmatimonadota bacterium]